MLKNNKVCILPCSYLVLIKNDLLIYLPCPVPNFFVFEKVEDVAESSSLAQLVISILYPMHHCCISIIKPFCINYSWCFIRSEID